MAIGVPTVRGTAALTSSATSVAVTLSSGVSIGDTVFVVAGGRNSACTVTSVSDSRGNTWAVDANNTFGSANNTVGIASAPVTVALLTSDVVTATFAGGSVGPSLEAIVFSCSGIKTTGAFDKTAGNNTDLSLVAAFDGGTTAALSQADELVLGGFVFGGAATITAGSLFTTVQYLSSSGAASGDRPLYVEYKIVAATTAVSATGTIPAPGSPPGASNGFTATYRGGSDVTAPTVPTNVLLSGAMTPTGGGITWTASTDAVGVTQYLVYKDGVLYRTITSPGLFALLTNLSPSTTYSMTVSAKDAAGNESAQSTALNVVTFANRRRAGTVNPRPLMGVYRGAGATGMSEVREWERWLGRKVKCALDFMPTDNWGSVESPFNAFWNDASSPFFANGGERIRMGLTLVPDSNTGGATNPGTNPPTLAQAGTGAAGSGTYQPHWAKIADFLAARNLYNVTLRPGNEYNGNWSLPWQPAAGGGTASDFAAAYRDCVTSMRARATAIGFAQTWKFEYSLATGDNGGLIEVDGLSYPGDSYWDILSLNCYDESYSGEDVEARWARLLTSTPTTGGPGLNYCRDFVAAKGKVLAFGELGTVWHPSATNYAAADTPRFFQLAFDWISDADNRVAYWDWWDGSNTWIYKVLQKNPTPTSMVLPHYQRVMQRYIGSGRSAGSPILSTDVKRNPPF